MNLKRNLTNCAPPLADICLYSYEAEFIQFLLSTRKKQHLSSYIYDLLSSNNPDFENYLSQMYPIELEIKDMTESNTSASYLYLLQSIGRDGHFRTSLYIKCDHSIFNITNFPFLISHFYPSMKVLSHIWYDTPGLSPLMNVLFWG